MPRELRRLQDVRRNADGDPLGGFPDGVPREMRIARGSLDPAVTEEPADDRQAFAERQRPRSEAVPDVVDAHDIYLQGDVWRCMEMSGDELMFVNQCSISAFSNSFIVRSVLELSLDESEVLLIVLTSSRPGP